MGVSEGLHADHTTCFLVVLKLQQVEDSKLIQLNLTVYFYLVESLDPEEEEGSFVGLRVDSLKQQQFGTMGRD